MTGKQWLIITIPILIIIVGLIVLIFVPAHRTQAPSEPAQNLSSGSGESGQGSASASSTVSLDDLITVASPLSNSVVSSPLTISGKARGNWYFEATAPAELLDGNGNVIAQGHITAQGDWMSTDYVPFTASLTFTKPATKTGTLVLKNDNPSGDPSRGKELDIPVTF